MRAIGRNSGQLLAGVTAAFLLAGCGPDASDNQQAPSSRPASPESTAPRSTPPRSGPSITPTKPTKPTTGPHLTRTTLTGRLVEPVEAGCVVLDTDDGPYLLLGVPEEISKLGPGTELVVRGSVARSTMTTCQQGTPFTVDSANPA